MLRLKKERDRETEIAIHTSKYRNGRVCKLSWVFGWMEWIVMVIVAQGATSTEGRDSAGLKIAPANPVSARRLHSFLISILSIHFKKSALIYSIDPSVCVTPTIFNVIVLCGCIQFYKIAVIYCHWWFQEESWTFMQPFHAQKDLYSGKMFSRLSKHCRLFTLRRKWFF